MANDRISHASSYEFIHGALHHEPPGFLVGFLYGYIQGHR